jgi:hypothetical protein
LQRQVGIVAAMDSVVPPVPKPTKALGCQVLGISILALMCATFYFGPFLSLVTSVYALIMMTRQPAKHAGKGLALVAIALSLMGIAFVVLMGPTFGERGDLRYRGLLFSGRGRSAEAMETSAINRIRYLMSAEAAYANDHDNAVATPGCLESPATCTPPLPAGTVYLSGGWTDATVEKDWVTRFHLGAPAADGKIERYAVTAVRKSPGRNAHNALCGDSTGALVFSTDALEPRLHNDLCDPSLQPVR